MSGDGSIEYWSQETSHYSSHHCNSDGISDDICIEVSADDGIRGHRSPDIRHSSSSNCGVYYDSDDGIFVYMSQETIQFSSHNRGVYHFGDDVRGGSRSKETSHSSSINHISRVHV